MVALFDYAAFQGTGVVTTMVVNDASFALSVGAGSVPKVSLVMWSASLFTMAVSKALEE